MQYIVYVMRDGACTLGPRFPAGFDVDKWAQSRAEHFRLLGIVRLVIETWNELIWRPRKLALARCAFLST